MKSFLMFLMCLMFLGFGIYMQFFQTKGFIETEGVITRIESTSHKGKKRHTAYVSYTVDDQSYEGRSNVYKATYKEGKTIKIFYDPEDPNTFKADPGILGWVFIGVAAVMVFFTGKLVFGKGRKTSMQDQLT